MTIHMSVDEFNAEKNKLEQKTNRNRYHAKGEQFKSLLGFEVYSPSQLQCKVYMALDEMYLAKKICSWAAEVPFRLDGGTKHTVDAVVFLSPDRVVILDAKGCDHKEGIRARKQVEAKYGFQIHLVKSKRAVWDLIAQYLNATGIESF